VVVPGGVLEVGNTTAVCPAGKVVLGGGYETENVGLNTAWVVDKSRPVTLPGGLQAWWVVMTNNDLLLGFGFYVYAICAAAS